MRMAAPIVAPFRTKSRDDSGLNAQLKALLSSVAKCATREELEHLLGLPSYAMNGELFGQTNPDGAKQHPDLVECYARGRINIELWYRDNRVWQTVGYLMPTAWDFVCGIEL